MHNAGDVCITWRCHVRVWVGVRSKKNIFGAVWLRPLTNLEVPFGAGACTLELCRFIWCGEYRSAVKVSTCNTNPTITGKHMVPPGPLPLMQSQLTYLRAAISAQPLRHVRAIAAYQQSSQSTADLSVKNRCGMMKLTVPA
jgi:hypothetical protein